MYSNIDEFIGKTIVKIERKSDYSDELFFNFSDGSIYKQHHEQDCCEYVEIEDIDGDLNDLIGYPLLQSEEVTQDDPNASESGTWTFYKFATVKGYVTIRWYGTSNGYYSESACITKIRSGNVKEYRKIKLNEINKINE